MTELVKTKETIDKEVAKKAKVDAEALAKAEAEASDDVVESKVTEIVIPGKVLVKNISKHNIHTESGKICKDCEGYVTIAEAKAESQKDALDRQYIEV